MPTGKKSSSIRKCRSPHGERGLKLQCPQCDGWFVESLPAWGAWVEIYAQYKLVKSELSRSPHGERGLKYYLLRQNVKLKMSLPAWGAWVEIGSLTTKF